MQNTPTITADDATALNTTELALQTATRIPDLRLVPNSQGGRSAQLGEASSQQAKNTIQQVALSAIRTDGDTRARIDVNPVVTAEYASALTVQ
jgi:hypothetical protein